jgi:hypothetical protein
VVAGDVPCTHRIEPENVRTCPARKNVCSGPGNQDVIAGAAAQLRVGVVRGQDIVERIAVAGLSRRSYESKMLDVVGITKDGE